MRRDENERLVLPKNIRQMGTLGDTYRVYVEDFVYTYVHQFIHQRKKEEAVLAAVLLGETVSQDGQEYIFIHGAQKVDFQFVGETAGMGNDQAGSQSRADDNGYAFTDAGNPPAVQADPSKNKEQRTNDKRTGVRQAEETQGTDAKAEAAGVQNAQKNNRKDAAVLQQEFWNRVYQRIKEAFDDCEILGWYFNLDGSALEISPQLQNFFEATYRKGSRFLYYEDSVEKEDAFFVQEQHRLQRLSGYAVYYEKNPQMQEFMIAERERMTPKPLRDSYRKTERDEVVENYRAIMNKLNEKPVRKKIQPVVYVAGAAVFAVVVAMGIGQIGNYQNLKVLEQTMQTISNAVGGTGADLSAEEETSVKSEETVADSGDEHVSNRETGTEVSDNESGTAENPDGDSAVNETKDVQTMTSSETGSTKDASDGTTTQADDGADGTESGQTAVSAGESTATTTTPSDYYIVQEGDSLASINRRLYGTTDRIEEICNLNSIENRDMIYEGQKLLLP